MSQADKRLIRNEYGVVYVSHGLLTADVERDSAVCFLVLSVRSRDACHANGGISYRKERGSKGKFGKQPRGTTACVRNQRLRVSDFVTGTID